MTTGMQRSDAVLLRPTSLDRKPHPVAEEHKKLISDWRGIIAMEEYAIRLEQ